MYVLSFGVKDNIADGQRGASPRASPQEVVASPFRIGCRTFSSFSNHHFQRPFVLFLYLVSSEEGFEMSILPPAQAVLLLLESDPYWSALGEILIRAF